MSAGERRQLLVLSDVHYASAAEQARCDYCNRVIDNPLRRLAIRAYRRLFWMHNPFAHNHLLDKFLAVASEADGVIANGDYSCDSGFIGVADEAARQSAAECLGKLRGRFGEKFWATIGDHELGKKPLCADTGGMRLESYRQSIGQLGLKRFWQFDLGDYVIMGVTSSLLALPVLESETLPEEVKEWRELRAQHIAELAEAFGKLKTSQRVLLFCHDPTALPYLAELGVVRQKLSQVERTIIGHLHSNLVLLKSRLFCGMPVINCFGHTPRRISSALRRARQWKPFNVFLCPSLAGIQLLKDGGYCSIEVDAAAKVPARLQRHRLAWKQA